MTNVYIKAAMGNDLATCPVCGHTAEAATAVSLDRKDLRPTPGGITMCTRCKFLGKYDHQLMVVPLNAAELEHLKANAELWKLIQHMKKGRFNG
jgi:hypothetical protein